ncbi:MAG TPA: LysR substrate-binding domain-containing protein [Acidimicrobiales bacterium]|nr:LysR substrate-binding domain-containing protein [Acidimicrobiales bacterium]
MELTLRLLRTIREIAARGTIAAAADALGYTASAVSQQVAALERATGLPVLERVGRSVRLTDVGRELVRHADDILARVEATEAALEEVAAGPRGEVRLAVFESVASALIPDVVALLAHRHPDLVVGSRELDPDEVPDALRLGEVDLAFVLDYPHAPGPREDGLEYLVLGREQFRLVVPVTEEADPVVDLASLCHRPFVASPAHMSCGRCVVQACREAGFEPVIRHQVDGYPATLRLVAGGAGVALVPDLGLIDVPAGVAVRDLAQTLHRTIELAYRRASVGRPAVRAVIDGVVDAARAAGLKPALDPLEMEHPLVQR